MSAVSLALDDLPTRTYGAQLGLSPREYAHLTDDSRAGVEGRLRSLLAGMGCGAVRVTEWLFKGAWTADDGTEHPPLWLCGVSGDLPHTDHPPKDAVTRDIERLDLYLWETPR